MLRSFGIFSKARGMANQFLFVLLFTAAYVMVILASELYYRRFSVNPEYTRKIAHTLASLSSLLFLPAFDSFLYVLLLAFIFFLIFFFGRKFGWIRSFDSVGRKTAGTYLLPLGVFLLFFIAEMADNPIHFILPVLILGISDPLAGFIGTKYKANTHGVVLFGRKFNKTWLGTYVFFISALFITIPVLFWFGITGAPLFFFSLIVALSAAAVEAISEGGIDNISVPLVVSFLLFLV